MSGCHISLDWTFKGMRTLILENKYLRVIVLLDKGSDIMEFKYKPMDLDLMWRTPMGYRNPLSFIPSIPNPNGSFIDYYGGGWQDILPIAGFKAEHRGAAWGIHGETALLPWSCRVESSESDEVSAHLWVECCRYPLRVDKWMSLRRDEAILRIRERVTNLSSQEVEFSWLQHPSFGEQFIEPGCRIDAPAGRVFTDKYSKLCRLKPGEYFDWPIVEGRNGEKIDLSILPSRDLVAEETDYLLDLKDGWYALTNPRKNLGFGLKWDLKVYRFIWFWQNYNTPDYPFYSRSWNIALEPCSSYPGSFKEQLENGTVIKVSGGGRVEVELMAVVYTGFKRVYRVDWSGEVEGDKS